MAQIDIRSQGRPLVLITFGADELTLESNVSNRSSAQAIGLAMERFGRSIGAAVGNQASALVSQMRTQGASAELLASAMAQMYSQLMGSLGLPDFAIDLEDWAPT